MQSAGYNQPALLCVAPYLVAARMYTEWNVYVFIGGYIADMKNLFQKNDRVFPHTFSIEYWKTAASELNNLKIIVLASMLIALASVLGTLQIYITPLIRVQISFLITGLGAMIYGPVIAMIGGVISILLHISYLLQVRSSPAIPSALCLPDLFLRYFYIGQKYPPFA